MAKKKNKPTAEDCQEFSHSVKEYAENNNVLYLSALAVYCSEQDISEDEVSDWITDELRELISEEKEFLNQNNNGQLPI